MITKSQAISANEFHTNGCRVTIGPRGARTEKVERWRRNGATQTWKSAKNALKFRIPVKHGLYDYHAITEQNARDFHVAEDCQIYRATEKLTAGSSVQMKLALDMAINTELQAFVDTFASLPNIADMMNVITDTTDGGPIVFAGNRPEDCSVVATGTVPNALIGRKDGE